MPREAPFEYFDRKAPWNQSQKVDDSKERENLVRRHVESLLEKTGNGRYKSPSRHGLESLLMEIVPCRSHQSLTIQQAFNRLRVERLSKALCAEFMWPKRRLYRMETLTKGQKEKLVQRIAAEKEFTFYLLTQNERIEKASAQS